MINKEKLAVGTKVGLTPFAMGKFFAYTGKLYTQMEVTGTLENGYSTAELAALNSDLQTKAQSYLLLSDIDYVAAYPCNKSQLLEGGELLLRTDLEIGKLYGKFSWPELYSHIKGKRVKIENIQETILTVRLLDSGQEYYVTPEMVAQVII